MSQTKQENNRLSIPKSGKYVILMFALLLSIFVIGASAQDETPTTDLPDYEVVSVVVGPNATTTTVNIYANKDTFVSSSNPDNNYGGSNETRTGNEAAFGAVRAMMQFDLSPIPSGSAINNATLNIYQSSFTPSGDSPYTIQSRFLASDWNEYAVTWNSHQPQWGDVMGTSDVSIGVGWRVVNVNNMVQEWVNGRANFGLILQGSNEAVQRSRNFATRETAQRPFITVNYTQDSCAPTTTVQDLPGWSPGEFTVSWSAEDCGSGGNPPSGVKNYDVEYSTDNANWTTWKAQVTETSGVYNMTSNGTNYYFRARARDNANNTGAWSEIKSTQVDKEAPVNPTITPTTILNSGYAFPDFPVSWSASDALSGLQQYEVQANDNQGSGWIGATFPASTTDATFPDGTVDYAYSLRVRATDSVGNTSQWSPIEVVTIVNDPSSTVLPFSNPVTDLTTFQVQWLGFANNTINSYTVYYRVPGVTGWETWNTFNGTTTFADFTVDGSTVPGYGGETIQVQFQVTAIANNSPPEPFDPNRVEANIIVDPGNNIGNNIVFLPLLINQ